MSINPYMAELLAEERMKEALREAEKARLIRAAKGPKKLWKQWIGRLLRTFQPQHPSHRPSARVRDLAQDTPSLG